MGKTCIYRIVVHRRELGSKFYIGQASNFVTRKADHLRALRNGTHKNQNLLRAFCKYGEDAFRFEILLICSVENLTMYEQAIVNSYDRDVLYNLCLECVVSVLGIKRSEATKAKRAGIWKGRHHTAEARLNISNAKKGWVPSEIHVEHLRRLAKEKKPLPQSHFVMLAEMKRGTTKSAAEIARRTATRRANAAAKGRSY